MHSNKDKKVHSFNNWQKVENLFIRLVLLVVVEILHSIDSVEFAKFQPTRAIVPRCHEVTAACTLPSEMCSAEE